MNIQANLTSSSLISQAKKPLSQPAQPTERITNHRTDDKQIGSLSASSNAERSNLFDQLESLDKKQALNFRLSAQENKSQKPIQSYLDNQALAEQELRDELHEQLGIDVLA